MKYYIIAGEASGDMYAADMMRELKKLDQSANFRFWGGNLMSAQAGSLPVKHYKDLAFMGFLEVLLNVRTILKNFSFCQHDLLAYNPDVLILVDYPGFNLKMSAFAKKHGIKTYYYIAPTLWAWNEGRIKKIKKYIDKLFVILPFEKEYYKKFDYVVDYIGYPLLDTIENETLKNESQKSFFKRNNLPEKPIIALLPGSRKQEISKILPVMLSVAHDFSEYQFVIAGVTTLPKELYEIQMGNYSNVSLLFNQTFEILKFADAALVKSGTSTMETALFNVPQVVCYKTSFITYFLARLFANVKYIGMVNLIMDKPVAKELIQGEFNNKNLKVELNNILDGANKKRIFEDYNGLREKLGGSGASERLARLIYSYLTH